MSSTNQRTPIWDADMDGVHVDIDQCQNTVPGMTVNAQGCVEMFSDNFEIEVFGESCKDKKQWGHSYKRRKNAQVQPNGRNGGNYGF